MQSHWYGTMTTPIHLTRKTLLIYGWYLVMVRYLADAFVQRLEKLYTRENMDLYKGKLFNE